jgi:tellurite resistance protein
MRITGSWDNFSVFLLLITYFFVILLAVMHKSFRQLKFFLSWWAFTFPLTAATIASVVAFQITHFMAFRVFSWLLLGAAILVISIVAWHTIATISKGEICVQES